MSAAMITALAALIGAPVTGLAAVYGSRLASRATREVGALKGYNTLTDQLQEELTRRTVEVAGLRADVAARDAVISAREAEIRQLRETVQHLGGTP